MKTAEQQEANRDSLIRAMRTLTAMEAKLKRFQDAQTEPIAIVGMGCHFPGGANNPESFWELLAQAKNTATTIPQDRWDSRYYYDPDPLIPGKINTSAGNFLRDPHPALFDPGFFNITTQEALSLDPQQRLLLEVTWEALEYGGIAADELYDSNSGVFIGMSTSDYQFAAYRNPHEIDGYRSSGNAASVASGRISYYLGLRGPTYTVDAACSSALVALHQACHSLRIRECHLAIVGGVNIVLLPGVTIAFSKMGMLSPDGKCKAFSANADGYGRGEGCGVIIIKRISDALRDHDNILALIKGSAVNHTGHSGGLVAPNSISQQDVIRNAQSASGVSPEDINYIEAHGTGTPWGDAIELSALAEVFGERSMNNPLRIGSVKTNIGHTEAASGMASIIKTVLALNHEQLTQHLNVKELNPVIEWDKLPLKVTLKAEKWAIGERPRLAGINSFGFSGTNVHVILEGAEKVNHAPADETNTHQQHILTISAKNSPALSTLRQDYAEYLKQHPDCHLADVVYTASAGRVHFQQRLALIAEDRKAMIAGLIEKAQGDIKQNTLTVPLPDIVQGEILATPQVGYTFADDVYNFRTKAGGDFYSSFPQFRKYIDDYSNDFLRLTGVQLPDVYCSDYLAQITSHPDLIHKTKENRLGQAIQFVTQIACARMLMSWGIQPSMVTGSGVGLISASYITGILEFEDGLKLVLHDDDENFTTVDNLLLQCQYKQPTMPIVNPLSGVVGDKEFTQPSFWAHALRSPGKRSEAIQTMRQYGINVLLHIGEQTGGINFKASENSDPIHEYSIRYTQDDSTSHMLKVLSALYVHGIPIEWKKFYQSSQRVYQKVSLPTYPFQRKKYWLNLDEVTHYPNAFKDTHTSVKSEPQHGIPLLPPFDLELFIQLPHTEQVEQIEVLMRYILAHVMDCDADQVDFSHNYSELGISSIQNIQIMMLLRGHLNLPIKPRDFYKNNIQEFVAELVSVIKNYEEDQKRSKRTSTFGDTHIGIDSHNDLHLASTTTFTPEEDQLSFRNKPNYVFLLSTPRAGSTLLRVMLDAHPGIYAPPELFLLLYENMLGFVNALQPLGWVDGVTRAVMHLKDIDFNQAKEQINRWTQEEKETAEVYQQLHSWSGRILVDKTPAYAYDLMTIQRIKNIPNSKVIFLSRHPYTAIKSMVGSRLAFNNFVALGLAQKWDNYKQAEQHWSILNRNIMDLCEGMRDSDWIHVRYEDLVTNPYQVMRKICVFLSIPYHEAVLHPYAEDHDTVALQNRRATGGDRKFNEYVEIDASKGEEWLYIQLPHHLGGIARSVAVELGYTLPQEQSAGYPLPEKAPIPFQKIKPQVTHQRIQRHQKYDHPKRNMTGAVVRQLRKWLRRYETRISYERGLRILHTVASSKLIQIMYGKHLQPAWQVLEIIMGKAPTPSLKGIWLAHYFNAMLDWVLLKRRDITIQNDRLETEGIIHLDNALAPGKGVIMIGHHCQPIRLWEDFARYNVRACGVTSIQVIGGLREKLPNAFLSQQGQSRTEQKIIAQQLENSMTVLQKGGVVYIDADGAQGTSKPIELPCLGRSVPFMTGFAELALHTDASVVPVTGTYLVSGEVQIKYFPALSIPENSLSRNTRVHKLVKQYVSILEMQWRDHPENIPLHICRIITSAEKDI